jgi:protocatechuate 3,4-dioxygenase beta subunit
MTKEIGPLSVSHGLTRRSAIKHLAIGLGALPFLEGCAGPTASGDPDAALPDAIAETDAATIDAAVEADAAIDDAGSDAPAPDDAAVVTDGGPNLWAIGGTASMAEDYPDPFTAIPAACALLCPTTLGPCYAATLERRDISEGYPGLPMRLALRVLDDACAPVEGAVVDIWHTRNSGLYSGSDAATFCTTGDPDAMSHRYFRGTQTTDPGGRVDFDSCFPGWYRGRAIHIHFTIRIGEAAHVTSQLFFDDAVTHEIFRTHPDYAVFGLPDRTNATDGIFPDARSEDHVLEWERQPDRVMLAWKTLVIRASLLTPLCT